jgi:PAS domain S-box-containing protein
MGKGSKLENNGAAKLVPGGGEMGERIRSFDWGRSPLGPIGSWEQSLKTSVSIMLNSRCPMFVWWGPELINLYNDGCIPILGARHPDGLARPASDIWREIWGVVGAQADLLMNGGQATSNVELLLPVERHGIIEEAYFTFAFIAITDNSGKTGGLFCTVTEETGKAIGGRGPKLHRDPDERTVEGTLSERLVQSSDAAPQIISNGHSATAARLPETGRLANGDSGRGDPTGIAIGRILLVGDSADMRVYVGRLLTDAGFAVDVAADGVEAIDAARANTPELILADIMMPRMNGVELLQAVRGDERLRVVPFIMLSARTGEESRGEDLDAGADDYLIKPFSANELLSRVRSHLKLHRRRIGIERQLRESAERYRAFIENSSEGIWRVELDEPIPIDLPPDEQIDLAFERGYLAECNDAFARQYGCEKGADVVGARLSDILVADDPKNREFLRAFIASGYRLNNAESHERDRGGDDRYFLNNFVGLIEDGRLVRAWGTQRDVTDAHQAQEVTALLASIVSSSDDAIVSKDLDGYITSWNAGAEKVFGYRSDEVIGKHISILAIGGDRRESEEILARTRRGERLEHYETVQVRKDGTLVPVSLSTSPIVDPSGKIVGLSKFARDISEQKQARATLDRYRLLSMQARDIILFIEPGTGRIVEANQAAVNIYGYDHDRLLTMTIRDLRAPETLDGLQEQYKKADRFGHKFETVHLRSDGSRIPVEVNSIGADIGSDRFLISIIRDISERKAAEEAFLQNQAILALAMESSRMGAWTRDLRTDNVWWSEELEAIFGLPRGAFSRSENAFYDLVHEEDRALLFSEVERSIAEHLSYTVEFRFYHSDGSVRWMEGRGQAVYSESGEPVRIYGVGIDITERRKLQESVLENEERFRGLMEQAPFSIQLFDTTGRTIRVNRSWELLWGVSADQVGDYNVLEDPQLEAKGIAPYLRRAFAGEAVEVPPILYDPNETLPGRTKNPEPKRWVSAVAYPLKAADGTVREVALVHQDITARRNAEESVRQTLGQLALITNIAPVFISHYDRDEHLKFANRAFTERYDLRPEDCIGKHVSTIIGKEAYAAVREYIKRVIKGESVEFDAEVPYPVIGNRYVHVSYAPEFDANGDVAGYVAAVTDITEHRKAEEEVRQANERFRIAEQASRGFIYDWNLRTDVVTRTEGFNRVLGYEQGEIAETGEAGRELVHPNDLEDSKVREHLASGAEYITSEYRMRHKNGSWVWFRDEAAVILDARGGAVRMIGSTVDITARKLAENRLVLLAQVSELIRTVNDPAELMCEVSCAAGAHLEVRRCLFNEIDLEKDLEIIHGDYCDGVASVAGTNSISDYSSVTLQEMLEGKTVVNTDAKSDPRTSALYDRTYAPNGERAYVAVPLLRENKWVASLWVSDDTPRQWSGAEVKLLETVAERTWTAVERLRLDRARLESEERFTKAFNSSPLSLTISSLKTGELIAVNDTFVEITGYPREEAIGRTTAELGLWARVDDREDEMEQVRREGQVRNVEYEFTVRDGSVVVGLLSAERVEIGGEPFALTVIQDITEQRRAQQALLRAERRAAKEYLELLERIIPLAEALGTAPDMKTIYRSLAAFINASMEISAFFVSFYDAERGLRIPAYVWGEGEEIDISELPPMPIVEGGGPNSQAIFERRAVITNGYWEKQKDRPHVVVRDNGVDPNSSLVVPMMLQNKVLGTLEVQAPLDGAFHNEHAVALEMAANLAAVSIDNLRLIETEANARAEAETANRMKDEFLSVLSHELRTPLNAMLGWIRIMRGGGLDDQRSAKALEIIERNTRQQSSLIEDLLDVSRIISGKMRIEKELIDLTPTLNAVAETIRPLAAAKDVIFLVEGVDEPLYMRGDAVRLQQAVTNLLQNSVKFTPAGGVVTLSYRRSDLTAELTVSDTGAGIAQDFLPHIFDRFSQADLSTKRSNTGLGLGLTIVSNIVDLHGGSITAESDGPGTGAVFKVQLPLEPEYYHQIERSTPHVDVPDCSIDGLRILVVDDDLDSTVPLTILLEREGAEMTGVDTASEALEQLRERDFDLLISDIGMPEMDGYELISIVRSLPGSRNSDVKAIAFTAYASEDDRKKLEDAGFDAHVAKPLDFDELLGVIARLAKKRKA